MNNINTNTTTSSMNVLGRKRRLSSSSSINFEESSPVRSEISASSLLINLSSPVRSEIPERRQPLEEYNGSELMVSSIDLPIVEVTEDYVKELVSQITNERTDENLQKISSAIESLSNLKRKISTEMKTKEGILMQINSKKELLDRLAEKTSMMVRSWELQRRYPNLAIRPEFISDENSFREEEQIKSEIRKLVKDGLELTVPKRLKCSLTGKIVIDPVRTEDNILYERRVAILLLSCVVTRKPVDPSELRDDPDIVEEVSQFWEESPFSEYKYLI